MCCFKNIRWCFCFTSRAAKKCSLSTCVQFQDHFKVRSRNAFFTLKHFTFKYYSVIGVDIVRFFRHIAYSYRKPYLKVLFYIHVCLFWTLHTSWTLYGYLLGPKEFQWYRIYSIIYASWIQNNFANCTFLIIRYKKIFHLYSIVEFLAPFLNVWISRNLVQGVFFIVMMLSEVKNITSLFLFL